MPPQTKELVVQFTVPPRLKKAIKRRALDEDVTVRTLILAALKNSGIPVKDEDLLDRRKRR